MGVRVSEGDGGGGVYLDGGGGDGVMNIEVSWLGIIYALGCGLLDSE